jgi:Fe-Mn family superoxide dismutase
MLARNDYARYPSRGIGIAGCRRLLIIPIEKRNVNVYPMLRILMVLDVWEHAYYLDYRNERPRFVEAVGNITQIPSMVN